MAKYVPPVPIQEDVKSGPFLQFFEALRYQANTPRATAGLINPTTDDIPSGTWIVWKNDTSGEVRMWFNDGGVLKSVLLT